MSNTDTTAIELALDLLGRIAEDAILPAKYRVAARKHLRRLRRVVAETGQGEAA